MNFKSTLGPFNAEYSNFIFELSVKILNIAVEIFIAKRPRNKSQLPNPYLYLSRFTKIYHH